MKDRKRLQLIDELQAGRKAAELMGVSSRHARHLLAVRRQNGFVLPISEIRGFRSKENRKQVCSREPSGNRKPLALTHIVIRPSGSD